MQNQSKPNTTMWIVLLSLLPFFGIAQEGPSKAPESNTFNLSPDDLGRAASSVNLFTGEVSFPVNLGSAPGRNGLNISISAAYSSAGIDRQATTWNKEAPTGIMGLGWNIDRPRILVDNKSTGTRIDDEYFLSEGGSSNKLIRVGGSSTIKEYALENYKFWKILYYTATEKWEITHEDGTKFIYGDNTSNRSTIEWVVNWGNWIGSSSLPTNQTQQPLVWNISAIQNRLGDQITYEYENIDQFVGSSAGKKHTEASYLVKITSPTGEEIVLNYGTKDSYEYVEPHTEKPDTPYDDPEPDAYQERYEKKYLSFIDTYNHLGLRVKRNTLIYNTNLLGTGDLTKRILTSITTEDVNGKVSTGLSFTYNTTINLKGKLSTVTTSTGGVISYTYKSTPITPNYSERNLTINAPSGYAEPEVQYGPNYVLVSWRQLLNGSHSNGNRTVILELYEWLGFWKKHSLGSITGVQLESGYRKAYSTVLGDDFFAISAWKGTASDYKVRIYSKKQTTGNWQYNTSFDEVGGTVQRPSLLSGDNFVAFHTTNLNGYIATYVRENNAWVRKVITDPVLSNPLKVNKWYSTASNNWIISHQHDIGEQINLFYLNDLNEWTQKSVPSSLKFDSDYDDNSYWHGSNSFAVAMADDNSEFIYSWDINYNNFIRHNVLGAYADGSRVIIQDNSLINVYHEGFGLTPTGSFEQITKGNFTRFDGSTFHTLGNTTGYGEGGISVGKDMAMFQGAPGNAVYSYSKIYNPNTSSWSNGTTYGLSSTTQYFSTNHSFPLEPGMNNFISLNKLYEREPNGTFTYKDQLSVPSVYRIKNISVSNNSNYIIYDLTDVNGNPLESKVDLIKNGSLGTSFYTGGFISPEYTNRTVTYSWQRKAHLSAGPTFITSGQSQHFQNVTTLNLYRVVNNQIQFEQNHYPVVKVTTNDGIEQFHTSFVYDEANARFDPSGSAAQYNKVTTIPGSAIASSKPFGYTETYFHNIPSSTTKGDLLIGTPYETKTFDKDGIEKSSSETSFMTRSVLIAGKYFNYVISNSSASKVDGISSMSHNQYNDKGLLKSTYTYNYNSKGLADKITKEFKYAYEVYPTLVAENVFAAIAQEKSFNGTTVTSSSATQWVLQNGILQPHYSYIWEGTGSSDFSGWNSTTTSILNWKSGSEITLRDNQNNVIETKDIDGFYSTSVLGLNKRVTLGSFYNARTTEVLVEDFNDGSFTDSDPSLWIGGTGWSVSNKMLKGDNLSDASIFRTNWIGVSNTNFIAEFRMKFDTEQPQFNSNSGIGFHFNKTSSSHSPSFSGVLFNINPYLGTYKLSSYAEGELNNNPMTNAYDWHNYRIVREGSNVKVYVDGKLLFNENANLTTGIGNYFGFYINGSKGYIDDFRIYPNDASAVTTSYDPNYLTPESQVNEDGFFTQTLHDDGVSVAQINTAGLVASTSSSYSPKYDGSTFSESNMVLSHSTVPAGTKGFIEDFSIGDRWLKKDQSNGITTNWIVDNGKLHINNTLGATNSSTDIFHITLPENLTGRIGIEFSLRANAFADSRGLGIAVGDGSWTVNGVSGSSIWMGLYLNNLQLYEGTNPWTNIKTGLNGKTTYRIKVLIDLNTQKADYFVDGKLLLVNKTLMGSANSIKKIAFFNYGYGSTVPSYYIDNLVVYTDPSQSTSYADAGGKQRQTVSQISPTEVMVSESFYDALGRASMTTKPTLVESDLKYRLGFVTSYNLTNGTINGEANTYNGDQYATSKTEFENSPLGRPLKSTMPGITYSAGSNNNPVMEYGTNTPAITQDLPPNQYSISKSISPDGGIGITIKDKSGKLVMSKTGPIVGQELVPQYTNQFLAQGQSFNFTAISNQTVNYSYDDFGGANTRLIIGTSSGGSQIAFEELSVTNKSFFASTGVTYYFQIIYSQFPAVYKDFDCQTIIPYNSSYCWQDQGNNTWCRELCNPCNPCALSQPPTDSTSQQTYYVSSSTGDVSFQQEAASLNQESMSAQVVIIPDPVPDPTGLSEATISYVSAYNMETTSHYLTTTYEYDVYGNVVKIMPPNYHNPPNSTVDPNLFVTTNTYDFFGRVKTTTTPDNGTTKYIYDTKSGRLRFMQDAKGASQGKILYTKYDTYGRIIETGYHSSSWAESTLQGYANNNPSWPSTPSTWRKKYTYGTNGMALTSQKDAPIEVKTNNDGDTAHEVIESYTYNEYGDMVSKTIALPDESLIHTITYTYDNNGNVISENYGEGPGEVIYTYDMAGRLKSIGTTTDPDFYASYEYDKNGAVATQKTNNNSIVKSFTYDITGRLTQLDDNYFNETIAYTSSGYGGDGYHNGSIARTTFDYKNITSFGGFSDSYHYAYRYNNVGQLTVGDNSVNNAWDIGVGTGNEMSYDANGNILKKRKGSSTKTYTYDNGTNKINRTSGSARQYHYDLNGNITQSVPKNLMFLYDPFFNKASSVTHPTGSSSFLYRSDGERVFKQVIEGTDTLNTFYIRGASDYPLIEKFRDSNNNTETKYYIYGASGMIAMIQSFENNLMMSSATLEESTIAEEEQKFQLDDGYGNRINAKLFNHTPGDSSKYSLRLSGRYGEQQGLVFTTKVRKGDTVRMEVFAKYIADENDPNVQALLMAIASMTTGSANPGNGEGIGNTNGPSSQNNGIGNGAGNSANKNPKAFLNYILFDTLFNMVDAGYIPVTEEAAEKGNNSAHEQLYIEKISDHDGYMQAFVSNESQQPKEVYFDDMSMTLSSTDQVYFFSTDHLGSTRVMIRQDGSVMKRIDYDPWGEVTRTSGTEDIAYQYTGQEKDKELGLWNFRARFYDADLGRFYGVDPADQFASPYTAMGNNAVMVIDPDGELAWFVPVIFAGVQLTADLIRNDFEMSTKEIGISLVKGAIQGTLAAIGPTGIATWQGALVSSVSSQLPSATVTVGDVTVGISPSFAFGSNGFSLGANIFGSVQMNNFSIGAGLSTTYGSGHTERANFQQRLSYGVGYSKNQNGIMLYRSHFSSIDGTSQIVGGVGVHSKDISVNYENDWPMGDGGDRFRTAALKAQYKDFHMGFNLFTGAPSLDEAGNRRSDIDDNYIETNRTKNYRLGAAYFGYKNYSVGGNSEHIRHLIQNKIIHKTFGYSYFPIHPDYTKVKLFTNYSSNFMNTLW